MKKTKFSAVAVNNTITLMRDDDVVTIQKSDNEKLFETVFSLLSTGKIEEAEERFFEFKEAIRKYTDGNFYFDGGVLRLKDDDEPIPTLLGKKLLELKDNDEKFMPLIRFWKKLKNNPDPNVREQLYGFLSHNHIPLTENGDIVCEKGVKETAGGKLVDQHTGKIDNSIGMTVTIPRSKVDSDPNRTCSHGLHVGAPEFVRKWWTSGLIVEVLVDPVDFVAVPKDYGESKARVCRYQVIGLAPSSPKKKLIYKFEDIIAPTFGAQEEQKKREQFNSSLANDHSGKPKDKLDFDKMTARAIVDYVRVKTGTIIRSSLKNKKQIIRKATEILGNTPAPTFLKKSELAEKKTESLIAIVKLYTDLDIKDSKKGKQYMLDRVVKILTEHGIEVK